MGRLFIVSVLVGSLLVGSVALAQQGLIVEPWRRAPVPVAVPALRARVMPESGLGGGKVAPAPPVTRAEAAAAPSAPVKWSPPVVELLVDPWAKERVAVKAPRPRWRPETVEIIDPWADKAAPVPRVATGPVGVERPTIF